MKDLDLAKAYNAKEVEDSIYQKWEESGFFNPDNLKGEPYSIMMPPPNVTGVLHLGHALENALMDVMTRYQRMEGKKVLLLPGTDHAAVATQARVEKNLIEEGVKNPREELGREKLLKIIRDYAEKCKATILSQIRKMGTSCDWSRLAYTFDEQRSKAVNEVFKKMYNDGLIYRGYRVVNWSVKGQSTCSDDELVYVERPAKLYTFKYSKDFPISIATTRPETKLGDTAVAVNPKDKRYKKYIGQTFRVNFGAAKPLKLKIIADESVDPEFGTGALGVTPAHSPTDFEMYEKQRAKGEPISLVQVIDAKGKMTVEAGGDYEGLGVEEARKKVVKRLEEQGLLEKVEDITQNVGTSDRFGDVVEAIPMTQWFVDVNKEIAKKGKSLKDLMREAVTTGHKGDSKQKVKINPKRFEKLYFQWIDNLRDWCISRQIWWGHRIPVWWKYDIKNDIHVVLSTSDELVNIEGLKRNKDLWFDLKGLVDSQIKKYPKDTVQKAQNKILQRVKNFEIRATKSYVVALSYEEAKKLANTDYVVQDPDTLDTWFSSGLWIFSTLGFPERTKDLKTFHPTNWMQMGYEILFFWMARMILMSTYVLDEIPFYDVYIHGILRDEKGRKFSKSLGTGLDPVEVIEKYGADTLRLSLLIGVTPGNDSKFYIEKVEGARNFVNKLWNISRYILTSVEEAKEVKKIKPKTLADEWILSRLNQTVLKVTEDLENYNFSSAGEALRDFTWNELADWYLEISKIEKGKDEILLFILDKILRLWHPFTPFVTEEIWSKLGGEKLLMIEKYPETEKKMIDKKAENNFGLIRDIITGIRNARTENKIEPAKKIKAVIYTGKNLKLIEENLEIIKFLARLSEAELKKSGPKIEKAAAIVFEDIEIYLPLEGLVDLDKEKERLQKEIDNLSKYVKGLEGKMGNENFVKNAPSEVVEQEKEKLESSKEKLGKLQGQLKNLE